MFYLTKPWFYVSAICVTPCIKTIIKQKKEREERERERGEREAMSKVQ
jgi:hypothetical protein